MLAALVLVALTHVVAGADHAVGGAVEIASLSDVSSLEGEWRFHAGDDTAWADAGYDDSAWSIVTVPKGLGAQGYRDLVGPFWMRLHVRGPRPQPTDQLAIQLWDVDSAYELYVDGARVGGCGSVVTPQADDHDHAALWRVSSAALDDGELVVAVRGFRSASRKSSNPSRGGIVHGPNRIGPSDVLARAMVTRDLDMWFLAGGFFAVGLYHLQLFRRRRALREYLWFGLFALSVAAYVVIEITIVEDVLRGVTNGRVWFGFVWASMFTFIRFLLLFLRRPMHRAWQLWMIVGTAWCAVALAWPTQWFVHWSLLAWEVVILVPLLVGIVIIIARAALAGDPEARTIALGTGLLVATSVNNILRSLGLQTPEITNYCVAGFVLSMAVSLSNRFTRVYSEVDELLAKTLRLSKLKDEFLANTSHELRTPLNAIINIPHGLLEQIEERAVVVCGDCGALFERELSDASGESDDVNGLACPSCDGANLKLERRRFAPDDGDALSAHLHSIIGSGEHLLAVVNDILDSSKLASGTLELHKEKTALAHVVTSALATVAPLAADAGVSLVSRVDPALSVDVDRLRLTQVLINLVMNAVKFSPKGSAVEVDARVDDVAGEPASEVALTVTDHGTGIAPEHHALIFESFRQVDAGHTRRHGGAGLGLAIAKQLVELHGGTLTVDSALGDGAVFTVRLPLQLRQK